MQPDFPPQLIARSLDAATRFADAVIPLVQEAFRFSATQIQAVPPGGAQDHEANLQGLPTLFRTNMIKMVKGHNRDEMRPPLARRGSPNNGLWLGIAGNEQMARIYKAPKKYPIRPSGLPQERLITQQRYKNLLLQPQLLDAGEPVLDALLMWHAKGYEMVGAFVVIPNGWDEAANLVELGRRDIVLPDVLEGLAAFADSAEDTSLIGGRMPIFVPSSDAEWNFDDENAEDEEALHTDFESPEESLFDFSEGREEGE